MWEERVAVPARDDHSHDLMYENHRCKPGTRVKSLRPVFRLSAAAGCLDARARKFLRLHFIQRSLDGDVNGGTRKDDLIQLYVNGFQGACSDFCGHLMNFRSHALSVGEERRISGMRVSKLIVYGR